MLGLLLFLVDLAWGILGQKRLFSEEKIQFVIFISSRKSLSVSAENKALRFPKKLVLQYIWIEAAICLISQFSPMGLPSAKSRQQIMISYKFRRH